MDESETVYKPPSGFVDDTKDPLIELDLSDSTELWLIHLPTNPLLQPADFDAKEMTLKLYGDGHLGSFKGTSGKSYDVVSSRSSGPGPVVFSASSSKTKIVGKISRCVSLIHYPEPGEFQARNNLFGSSSLATSVMSGGRRLPAPTRSVKPRNYPPSSGLSTPSSEGKSTISGISETSKASLKRKHAVSSKSSEDSGKRGSGVTSAETLSDHSQERNSKKKRKH